MKTRLGIVLALAAGLVFSITGTGLALSGLSGMASASQAQYVPSTDQPVAAPSPAPTTDVRGETETNQPTDSGGSAPAGGTRGETETSPSADVQPSEQVEAGATNGDELPFTGFAAIPVIVVGMVLLAAGMVLRRRGSDDA